MTDTLLQHEMAVRLGAFLGLFALIAGLESLAPAQPLAEARRIRWPRNLLLLIVDGAVVRLLVPLLAVGAAVAAAENGFGVFHWLPWPLWLEIVLTLVVLDLTLYGQHRLFHLWPWLWRLHRAHHSDRELDVTSGLRFHPVEIVASMVIKMAAVALLGAPVLTVVLFEVILNAASMFSHSNLRLPEAIDRMLRKLLVTPAMHRIHHSEDWVEQRANFGFALSLWDRLFGSYLAQPVTGQVITGLSERRMAEDLRLRALLLDPLRPSP